MTAIKHGKYRTTEYNSWRGLRERCYMQSHAEYFRYGAKGVTVCDRWRESFSNFLEDMGEKPSPKHSLDRIDTKGNYEPDNCRWATPTTQAYNQSKRADNTTGHKGIYKAANGKFFVRISKDKKLHHLGHYETMEEAIKIRKQAELTFYGESK